MRNRLLTGAVLVIGSLTACTRPSDGNLRQSFLDQIASTAIVRDFQRSGDEVTFSAPYGAEASARWRVRIDSAVVEEQADEQRPYKGTVKSSWFVNDQPIEPRGTYSDLPSAFLDKGISQDCWAFWEASRRTWSWL
jgi:hypothetical protein